MQSENIKVEYVDLSSLRIPAYNPRVWSKEAQNQLEESMTKFGLIDPLLVNSALARQGIIIGGNFRAKIAKKLGIKKVPVLWINIPDLEREKELCLRLNRNTGDWSYKLLAEFDPDLLKDIGFSGMELDDIFGIDDTPEQFDLEKELARLDIKNITIKKGEIYEIAGCRCMCGDSTLLNDVKKLYGNERADLILTDPPYRLDYLKSGKRGGKPTEGFGVKKNRKYLETDELPKDFTERWMSNIGKVVKDNFQIICYENWKNIREIWDCMEQQGWKVKNMLVWHLPNRTQGFAAKYKFFSKHDIALVGAADKLKFNFDQENGELQNDYETALYAIAGKPFWEPYQKGNKYCPSDFIEFHAADEKTSGQAIIFGVKPVEILLPYVKVLTKRGDLIGEPFGGSGSTAAAAIKMHRRCFLMEKSPVYLTVILKRLEKISGEKAKRVYATK
jgi:DNA modification methylase